MIGVRTQERRGERHEHTLQFRAPVFDHAGEELKARLCLMQSYSERSEVARARLSTVHRVMTEGTKGSPVHLLLAAFNSQNRAVLGLEGL